MLNKLERIIKRFGITQVTIDLGYRSTSTIRFWIKDRKIPDLAKEKVKSYLDQKTY